MYWNQKPSRYTAGATRIKFVFTSKPNKYKSTWTMRFSNFIQFSKLVLINVLQIQTTNFCVGAN